MGNKVASNVAPVGAAKSKGCSVVGRWSCLWRRVQMKALPKGVSRMVDDSDFKACIMEFMRLGA